MSIRVVEGFPQDKPTNPQGQSSHLQVRSPAATPDKRFAKNATEPLSPSSLRYTQSTGSDSDASTPRTPAQSQAPRAPAESPISHLPQPLPPSANLHIRPNPNSKAFSHPNGGGAKGANAGSKWNVNNIPLYSTPITPAPLPRTRTLSSGPMLMHPNQNPDSPNALSPPQHMLPHPMPPRLSLPWLHPSMPPGSAPFIPNVHGHGSPALGPGAYIHGLDTTPQPIHYGPYTYHGTGMPGGESPSGNHRSQVHAPHGHTLSTSTNTSVSTGTGPSTIDSGHSGPATPSTPLMHVYGRSPALSAKGSFDLGHARPPSHVPVHGGMADPRGHKEARHQPQSQPAEAPAPQLAQQREGQYTGGYAPPERNGVDVGRIEAGLDTRTTVMLKVGCVVSFSWRY